VNLTLPAVLSLALALPAQRWATLAQTPAKPAKPAQPFDVTGRAVTWDGKPIAGARVAVSTTAGPTVADLLRAEGPMTAADGTFTLHVPAAEANEDMRNLVVAAKGFAARAQFLSASAPENAAAAKPIPLGDVMLPPGQRMVGRVRDAAGQAVADALVVASDLLPEILGANENGFFVCSARTSKGGVFDLPCALPAGSTLRVEADGFFTAVRQPVAAGTPLEFELQPSGFLEGQVQNDSGKPLANARLSVTYETEPQSQQARADAQGMFRIPLRCAGRWRITAFGDSGEAGQGQSSLGDGPATGITIAMEGKAEAEAKRKFTVRAITKGSGAAVPVFRAVAMWGPQVSNQKPWLRQVLANQVNGCKPGADGTVEVAGPQDEGQPGAVYVVAEGHAPCLQADVTWDEKSPSITVELQPEASVRGVVRDAATKQPIAGAHVSAISASENGTPWAYRDASGSSDLRSAADGSFRLGQLDEGDWLVAVVVDERPPASPQTITLKAAEARGDVVVEVPVGARVAGKFVGAPIAEGCRVSLDPVPVGASSGMYGYGQTFTNGAVDDSFSPGYPMQVQQPGKPLAADGSFEFTGQALAHYTLLLLVPAPPRSGATLFLPVDSFRLRAAGIQRDFDLTGDRVCEVRGKVTLSGASTPFENLVVVAEPVYVGAWMRGGDIAQGTRAFVGRDGAFTLPVLRGSYRVAVVDLALGATIAASKPVEVGDADAECNVDVLLTKVTIELKPAGDAKPAAIGRLEVRCVLAVQHDAGMPAVADDSYDSGRGIRIAPGTTSITLALPAGDVCVLARSNAARLRHQDDGEQGPALGKVEFAVPGDKKPVQVLEVGPPPEIKDDEKGKDR
jgi:hypothetical protein